MALIISNERIKNAVRDFVYESMVRLALYSRFQTMNATDEKEPEKIDWNERLEQLIDERVLFITTHKVQILELFNTVEDIDDIVCHEGFDITEILLPGDQVAHLDVSDKAKFRAVVMLRDLFL